jgi:ABC-2 type transport system permease protein
MPEHVQSATGTIYDIGYQHYDGERLGRGYAVRTMFLYGLRSAFGHGRDEKSKLLPFALLFLAVIPAIIQAWLGAATGDMMRLISYDTYFQHVDVLLLIFCAAQAPELVSTDQHNRVLPLYFVRPIQRTDYAMGKLLALVVAVLILALAGQAVLFAGRLFVAEDLLAGWRAERGALLPILGVSTTAALLLASVSLAVAASIKARPLATAAIFGVFLVVTATPSLLMEALGRDHGRHAFLMNSMTIVSGLSHWWFGTDVARDSMVGTAGMPLHWYGYAAPVLVVAMVLVLLDRYRRFSL